MSLINAVLAHPAAAVAIVGAAVSMLAWPPKSPWRT